MAAVAASYLLIKNTKKHLDGWVQVCYFRGDMNQENIKRGKGRPSGSNSFVRIRARDLIAMVGEGAIIPVSKVWLRENGVELVAPQMAIVSEASVAEPQEQKIQFSLTTFEN